PEIINNFPALNGFFGFLFFASLVLAGITSLMSIIETYVAGLVDKFNITRTKAVLFGGGLAALTSLVFATKGGLYFLDATDYFINQFGVAALGLVEVIVVCWILWKFGTIKKHANEVSDMRLGWWWNISVGGITPIILGFMLYQLFRDNLLRNFDGEGNTTGNYEGYSDPFVLYSGWFVAGGALVLGIILSLISWKKSKEPDHVLEDDDSEREA